MTTQLWIIWALLLIAQNYSFTFVSRARNSGSLKRHLVAAIASNGVWFATQLLTVSAFFKMLTGDMGWKLAVESAVFYTAFTVTGSIFAHYRALKTEKGKSAVGANSKYAQIETEDWYNVQRLLLHVSQQQTKNSDFRIDMGGTK